MRLKKVKWNSSNNNSALHICTCIKLVEQPIGNMEVETVWGRLGDQTLPIVGFYIIYILYIVLYISYYTSIYGDGEVRGRFGDRTPPIEAKKV